MNYTDKQLEMIEQMASIYTKISDMAIMLDVPENELRKDIKRKDSEANKAYLRGKIGRKMELRKQEMQLAAVGSPLGLETARQALAEMEEDEDV